MAETQSQFCYYFVQTMLDGEERSERRLPFELTAELE